MRLRLRTLKSVVVLHVIEEVGLHDLDVVRAGTKKLVEGKLPFLLDFSKSKFQEGTKDKLSELCHSLPKDKPHYVVSNLIEGADAPSIEVALLRAATRFKEPIAQWITAEKQLQAIESESKKIDQEVTELKESGLDYEKAKAERIELTRFLKALSAGMEQDKKLIEEFSRELKPPSQDQVNELKEMKDKTLDFMKSRGLNVR